VIPKKQIEKLVRDKFGVGAKYEENPLAGGWFAQASWYDPVRWAYRIPVCASGPSRPVARAGINAMLFALPKRRRRS
jgi:hypothetical protein